MTRLIRWGHLANTDTLRVRWCGADLKVHQSDVRPEYDLDGTSFIYVAGASLPLELFDELAEDLTFAEACGEGFMAPRPEFYAGALEPAREALC